MDIKKYKEKGLDDDIMLKLLSAINRGSERKQLESISGISPMQIGQHLEELIKDGLVGYDSTDSNTLKITEKGSQFLISYERVAASQAEHNPSKGLLDLQ